MLSAPVSIPATIEQTFAAASHPAPPGTVSFAVTRGAQPGPPGQPHHRDQPGRADQVRFVEGRDDLRTLG